MRSLALDPADHKLQLRSNYAMRLREFRYLVAIIAIAGCNNGGTDVAPVSGHITLDGKPLPFAMITFQPEGKAPATGSTDQQGRYELLYKRGVTGAPIGPNTVSIMLDFYKAPKGMTLPARYNSQSELRQEVKPGPNVIDFDLKSDDK